LPTILATKQSIRHRVDEVCTQINAKCIHLGHVKNGDEGTTLAPLHDFCIANPSKNVIYLHDKGSFSVKWVNTLLRRDLLRGLSSKPYADAVDDGSCDVCSLRFSPAPHAHTPGNMWSARCEYVARLRSPREFRDLMDNGPKRTGWGRVGAGVGWGATPTSIGFTPIRPFARATSSTTASTIAGRATSLRPTPLSSFRWRRATRRATPGTSAPEAGPPSCWRSGTTSTRSGRRRRRGSGRRTRGSYDERRGRSGISSYCLVHLLPVGCAIDARRLGVLVLLSGGVRRARPREPAAGRA